MARSDGLSTWVETGRWVGRPHRGLCGKMGMAGIWDFWIGSNGRFLVTCHGMLVNWSKMPWHVGWLVGFDWEKEKEMLWNVGMGCGSHEKHTCPLKNSGWKTSLFFWNGPLFGDMLIFLGVHLKWLQCYNKRKVQHIYFQIYLVLPSQPVPWAVLWPWFWIANWFCCFSSCAPSPFSTAKNPFQTGVEPTDPSTWDIRISLASNQGTVFLEPC